MRAIKAQYFLAFAVNGCVLPYLPLFLRDRGLTDVQIGWVIATTGVAVLATPVVLTLLADLKLETRTLLAWTFGLGVAGLCGMLSSDAFVPILLTHALYAVALFPVMPLQDGLTFETQSRRKAAGLPEVPYHRIRVWGTFGFILPSLILWAWLTYDDRVSLSLVVGVGFSLLAIGNALLLPRLRTGRAEAPVRAALPTTEALRVMLRPRVLVFALATWLLGVSIAAYYAFYPLYLKELLGVDAKYVGLISNVGVVIEIAYMLGFGWLRRKLGIRGLMVVGALLIAARFALLAAFPNLFVAIATQAVHGMLVVVVHVAPPLYLDAQAESRYRSSMQGLYAMAITGSSRVVGNAASGYVADISYLHVFGAAAAVAMVAALIFLVLFKDASADSADSADDADKKERSPPSPSAKSAESADLLQADRA